MKKCSQVLRKIVKKKKKKYEMKNYTQDDSHFLVEMIFYHLKFLTER